jgi:hypothetical protein
VRRRLEVLPEQEHAHGVETPVCDSIEIGDRGSVESRPPGYRLRTGQ